LVRIFAAPSKGSTFSALRIFLPGFTCLLTKLAGLVGFNLAILSTNYVHFRVHKIAGLQSLLRGWKLIAWSG